MKKKSSGQTFFWLSFSDLMTSLFFIMLVLYTLTYINLKKKENELKETVEDLKHKLEVYEIVEQNLRPLKQDSILFRYESKFKRFTLAFDVHFKVGLSEINTDELDNYESTIAKIGQAGNQLKVLIDNLRKQKLDDPKLKNVSYLLIISGYASQLLVNDEKRDYKLSYQRAYSLWRHWKEINIDFEDLKYDGLIDLQISGNGWGGVGRFARDIQNNFEEEKKNQRFIIQIIPKISDTK